MAKRKVRQRSVVNHDKCIRDAQRALEKYRPGVVISQKMLMNFTTGKMRMSGPHLAVHWDEDKRPRGQSLPVVFCAYCPFCGKPSK